MPKYIPTKDDFFDENDDFDGDNQFGILSGNPFSNDQTITTDQFVIVEHDGVVTINGFSLNGFVDTRECSTCGLRIRVFDIDYDQYFCPDCNKWEEGWCSDPDCTFCAQEHPARPLPDFGIDDDTYQKRTGRGWSRFKFIEIDN